MLALLLAVLSLAPQAQEAAPPTPAGGRVALPVEGTHLVVRFVDDLGAPIGAHRIGVMQSCSGSRRRRFERVTDAPWSLDDSGVVRIPVQSAWSGMLSLRLHESGLFGHAGGGRIDVEWDGTAGERVITIRRLGSIRGRVITGVPRQAIRVSLSGATSGWLRGPNSGAPSTGSPPKDRSLEVHEDGTFFLEGITPGEVEITLRRGLARDTKTVMVEPGSVTDGLVFELENGGGWIVGRALAQDGSPLVGARVVADRATGLRALELSCDVDVDDQGRFRIGAAREGLYHVRVEAPTRDQSAESMFNRPVHSSQLVWCPASGDVNVDLVSRGPSLAVKGRLDLPDGLFDRIYVSVEPAPGTRRARHRIAADGTFEVMVPGMGAYDLVFVSLPGARRALGLARQRVDVRAPITGLKVALPRSGIDVDVDVGDHDHRAVDWSLGLYASDSLVLLGSYRGAHGSSEAMEPPFHFDGVSPGTYTLVVGSYRDEPRTVQRVIVRPGERSRVTLASTAFASLELPAAVMAAVENGDATIELRQDGSPFTWGPERIPPGPVHLLVRAEGRAAMHDLELAPNETRALDPDWKPVSSVEVQVTFQGHATSGMVDLEHELGFLLSDENWSVWFEDTGEPAVFTNVPPGRYRVLLEKRYVRTIDVKAGATTRVRVERR